MIVLCAYGSGRPPDPRTVESINEWLARVAWDRQRVHVRFEEVEGPDGYEQLVTRLWGTDDLLLWERDIVAPALAVNYLILCPVGRCAVTYPYHAGTLEAHKGRVGSAWENIPAGNGQVIPQEVKPPTTWADRVGLGLTFIRWRHARAVSLEGLPPGEWRTFDTRLMIHLYEQGWRWHVHWNPYREDGLVEHLHTVHTHEAERVEIVHHPGEAAEAAWT